MCIQARLHMCTFFVHSDENRLFSLCMWMRIVVGNLIVIAMRVKCCWESCTIYTSLIRVRPAPMHDLANIYTFV